MANNKYEFTGETMRFRGHTLHRIRAKVDFGIVKAGDLGGWVEDEYNLNVVGDAWVHGDAMVFGHAIVYGNAKVYGDAKVYGNARVYGDATVFEKAKVYGDANVYGNVSVYGDARVYGNAIVCGNASVHQGAWIYGYARVYGNVDVYNRARVSGKARVSGEAIICNNAVVRNSTDYIVFKNCWSSMRWFTYTRSNRKWKVGCFLGTGDELIKKAYADSTKSGKCYEAIVKTVEAIETAMQKKKE